MKQTALHQVHLQLKAKMVEFHGWQAPFQYAGVAEEYHAVRTAAGLFDVGFLGRIEVAGADATEFLQKLFTRNIAKLAEGSAVYGLFCNESGFILDDVVLFRTPEGKARARYLLTTNAVNTDKVLAWLNRHLAGDVQVADLTQTTAQLALQGPGSDGILEKLSGPNTKKLRLKHVRELRLLDTPVMVSRTGYTGEHGYEFFVPAERAEAMWNAIMEAGKEPGLMPCGTGSRDVLRLEMGYVLYGSDIDETRTPLEAGLGAYVDLKKEFIGRDALEKLKAEGVKRKLAGFVLLEKGVPRPGGSIFSENREIGSVTSGNHSPHVRTGIGLGYVFTRYAQAGQEVEIEVKDREIAAKIVDLPFYKKK
jgi:aminomethyltransferase